MIKTTAMLLEELKEYGSPKSKLARMAERGECFPITRGLYETDRNAPAYLLAGSIYGPSYFLVSTAGVFTLRTTKSDRRSRNCRMPDYRATSR